MIATPLAVPETERIADLLAEITGTPQIKRVMPADPPASKPDIAVAPNARASVRQMLEHANWRNDARAPENVAIPARAVEPRATEGASRPKLGPLPAPFGALTVAALFDLANWRNHPGDVRPLPLIAPPPPPGSEFTVAAMMPTFGWE